MVDIGDIVVTNKYIKTIGYPEGLKGFVAKYGMGSNVCIKLDKPYNGRFHLWVWTGHVNVIGRLGEGEYNDGETNS